MASATVIQPDEAARLAILVEQIAVLANTLDRECYFADHVLDRDPEQVEDQLGRLRSAICHMGWLADSASAKLGTHEVRGAAEKWMLPTVYHKAGVNHA